MIKTVINIICLLVLQVASAQVKEIKGLKDFNKIIVSPHIEAIFKQGNNNSVVIEDISVPVEKFKIEVEDKTLQVYLEGAKTVTKNKTIKHNGYKQKKSIYKNRVARVIITYKSVDIFSLRGEEKHVFESTIAQENCVFRIYGASEVTIKNIDLKSLKVATYGESVLNIDLGKVEKQKITAYGESKIFMDNVKSNETKLTAYGDGTFRFNIHNKFKVSSFGEAVILYRGSPKLKKGIVLGKSTIRNIE
ncbi:putative autotransporter adhesin-like protein [Tenacibaculum adriaticum]|uniref:Putative autotransporter adhesin-like protein n=1 Tax=Tenacibaculum adriaticum TaxID=413713 RepID=A0A5S5DU17_9FLAO|nr:DUF2807 domain-containing protein [Tenacibaculum adriaticum]TYP98342.1 putative autotransporter adhesin-like protein [Tenacibaculum adriaticum]